MVSMMLYLLHQHNEATPPPAPGYLHNAKTPKECKLGSAKTPKEFKLDSAKAHEEYPLGTPPLYFRSTLAILETAAVHCSSGEAAKCLQYSGPMKIVFKRIQYLVKHMHYFNWSMSCRHANMRTRRT